MFEKLTQISALNKQNSNHKNYIFTINKVFCNAMTISRKILIYSKGDSSTLSIWCSRPLINAFVMFTVE